MEIEKKEELAPAADRLVIRIWTAGSVSDDLRPPRIVGYDISAEPEKTVTPEEVPAEIWLSVPGITRLTVITAVPRPDRTVSARLFEYALKVAGITGGAAEEIGGRTESIGKPVSFPLPGPYSEKLFLGVWFPPRKDFDYNGLIKLIGECVPHILPVRYGPDENTEFTFEGNGGTGGLAAFLSEGGFPVCYGRFPATNLFVCPAGGAGQTGHIGAVLAAGVWKNDEWRYALKRLLRRLAVFTDAFFGQIVIGERRVAGGCWKGIPVMLGEACVIGGPYARLIPDCAAVLDGEAEAKGRICGDTPSGFADEDEGKNEACGSVFFEEPLGPHIDSAYLSETRKNIFGKEVGVGRGYPLESDFTSARVIPEEISGGCSGA